MRVDERKAEVEESVSRGGSMSGRRKVPGRGAPGDLLVTAPVGGSIDPTKHLIPRLQLALLSRTTPPSWPVDALATLEFESYSAGSREHVSLLLLYHQLCQDRVGCKGATPSKSR